MWMILRMYVEPQQVDTLLNMRTGLLSSTTRISACLRMSSASLWWWSVCYMVTQVVLPLRLKHGHVDQRKRRRYVNRFDNENAKLLAVLYFFLTHCCLLHHPRRPKTALLTPLLRGPDFFPEAAVASRRAFLRVRATR